MPIGTQQEHNFVHKTDEVAEENLAVRFMESKIPVKQV
jgi:hypothetical protein